MPSGRRSRNFCFRMGSHLFFLYGDHTECMEFPGLILPGHPGVVERAVAVRGRLFQ